MNFSFLSFYLRKLGYLILLVQFPYMCFAQQPAHLPHIQNIQKPLSEIFELMKKPDSPKHPMVTSKIFNQIINEDRKLVGGDLVTDGKVKAFSLSVKDAKSATVFTPGVNLRSRLFVQLTGAATLSDNFVSVIKNGSFQNNYTGGINAIWFIRGTSRKFTDSNSRVLQAKLRIARLSFILNGHYDSSVINYDAFRQQYISRMDTFIKAFRDTIMDSTTAGEFIFNMRKSFVLPGEMHDTIKSKLKKYLAKEEDVKEFLPPDWLSLKYNVAADEIKHLGKHIMDRYDKFFFNELEKEVTRETSVYDSLQLKANFSGRWVFWLSTGVAYNQARVSALEPENKNDLYEKKFTDEYASANFSFNIANIQHKFLLSVSGKWEDSRPFNPGDMITLSRQNPYIIGADTVFNSKEVKLYEKIPEKSRKVTAELMIQKYSERFRMGYSITASAELAFYSEMSAKAGIFIPISAGQTTVILMPELRFAKLTKAGYNFWRDQTTFGFTIATTLPKWLLNGKK